MTASAAISSVLEGVLPALTPGERWSAARAFKDSSSGSLRIVVCIGLLVVLAALLWRVSVKRVKRERKSAARSFDEYARQRGLSDRELELLTVIAHKAGLKRSESVFTMGPAFGLGAAKVMEEGIEGKRDAEQSEQLRVELSFLREKLGFGKRLSSSGESSIGPKKVTTRQIPVGKKLYVTRRKARGNADIESTVVRNNDSELAVTLSAAIQIVFGETWCVRYYSGASVWEFDTSVLSYDGETLVLNHSDSVRFVNRRRFLRVSVGLRAFVARFPFMRTFEAAAGDGCDFQSEASGQSCGTPRFVPAVVTEMAGPGLRIECGLEVEAGERILVILGLDAQGGRGSSRGGADHGKSRPVILEGIGEVRHVKAMEDGLSIAVELTGLNDSEVDELIRVTNAACPRAGEKHEESPVPVGQGV
ncbi:MAG: hypothetical protein JXN61_11115 [Sedimentisphaerales bacterium]|nr:hypothetical protein [Sedimentisphaerales bacterium]